MIVSTAQRGLFDPYPSMEPDKAGVARESLRGMIDQLTAPSGPGWKEPFDATMDNGRFKRIMSDLPKDEGEALWDEYDALAEQVFQQWLKLHPVRD